MEKTYSLINLGRFLIFLPPTTGYIDAVSGMLSQNTYSRYETNERGIPLELISKLADYYGTSVDYLMGCTDVFEPYPRSKQRFT
ncbi:MAG TPA: helix-turn-helix transcriptional regulator [Candidatus Ventrousia excrementavium]|uniref:Helix-turn-helix transcriptional regulator n=1 Tax=Candidatus Ventrousia excrementavium TaxID=2840961 RepID=A0A9D1LL62_9CLOT|nr:helix-turn-helix transcriptional regulator [Candidatus Ventrousia excrementavium]